MHVVSCRQLSTAQPRIKHHVHILRALVKTWATQQTTAAGDNPFELKIPQEIAIL